MKDYMNDVIRMIDLTQNKPLNQIIYEGLRSAIITGVIPMGERINEKNYAEALNVSRTPIREALYRIQDEDIVQYVPNFGVMVTRFSQKDVNEIYQIRVALDILASVNAANLMTKSREKEMSELLDKTEQAQAEGRVQDVIELTKEFNSLTYDFAEMPHLKSIQERLRDYLIRFRDISMTSNVRRQLAIEEHRMIFDYMRKGEVEKMKALIIEHLDRSKDFIKLEMDNGPKDE